MHIQLRQEAADVIYAAGGRLPDMSTGSTKRRFPWAYLGLVIIFAVPLWLLEAVTKQRLPVVNLPISALVAICPIAAALVLVYRESGHEGVKRLLKRLFDFKRIKNKAWYLPIFLLMPAIIYLVYGLLKLTGKAVPDLQFPVLTPLYFLIYFLAAIGEEAGWTGYATDRLQEYWENALTTSLFLGTFWAAWHILPWLPGHSAGWVAGQAVNTIAKRVMIVWIYNNTGKSLFAAVSFHAMGNVAELVLFPVYGSHYDSITAFFVMAVTAGGIIFLWGPRTLARFRGL